MNFITIDTETGGLFPSIHALLAIGATCSWSTSTFEAYITPESQPGKIINPEAAAKNGYSPEAWKLLKAQPLQQVYPAFLAWLLERKNERPGCVFVCHHLAFDKPFLTEAGRVCGADDLPGRHSWRCSQVLLGLLMDIGILAEGKTSLDRLIEVSLWPVERYQQHNALQDAFATQHGFTWLLSRLAKPSDTFSIERIRAERLRQMTSEGWTAEHDDLFVNGELRAAAIAYAMACDDRAGEDVSNVWPWEIAWWKPSEDPIRNLEKAAALLAAEIDRLKRKEGRADG